MVNTLLQHWIIDFIAYRYVLFGNNEQSLPSFNFFGSSHILSRQQSDSDRYQQEIQEIKHIKCDQVNDKDFFKTLQVMIKEQLADSSAKSIYTRNNDLHQLVKKLHCLVSRYESSESGRAEISKEPEPIPLKIFKKLKLNDRKISDYIPKDNLGFKLVSSSDLKSIINFEVLSSVIVIAEYQIIKILDNPDNFQDERRQLLHSKNIEILDNLVCAMYNLLHSTMSSYNQILNCNTESSDLERYLKLWHRDLKSLINTSLDELSKARTEIFGYKLYDSIMNIPSSLFGFKRVIPNTLSKQHLDWLLSLISSIDDSQKRRSIDFLGVVTKCHARLGAHQDLLFLSGYNNTFLINNKAQSVIADTLSSSPLSKNGGTSGVVARHFENNRGKELKVEIDDAVVVDDGQYAPVDLGAEFLAMPSTSTLVTGEGCTEDQEHYSNEANLTTANTPEGSYLELTEFLSNIIDPDINIDVPAIPDQEVANDEPEDDLTLVVNPVTTIRAVKEQQSPKVAETSKSSGKKKKNNR